jgi:hypothetical protein
MWFSGKTAAIDIIQNVLIGSEVTRRRPVSRFKVLTLIEALLKYIRKSTEGNCSVRSGEKEG